MMEHDYFDKRFKEGVPLAIHEMFYPIMQGYDSVMIKADIELGGTDQRFNMIAGRYLQKESGMEPQVGLFNPILIGLDGKNKMSKSLGNYVGLNFTPEDMFGKIMSIPDELIAQYFELLTDVPVEAILAMSDDMKKGQNPRDFKIRLGEAIVRRYHGEKPAQDARLHFENMFSKKEIPYDENTIAWDSISGGKEELTASAFITAVKASPSGSEASRLVKQGGFSVNEEKVEDIKFTLKKSMAPFTYKAGKRNFGKVV
jgi:tyrosyl-tRNA synthetase